MRRRDEPPKMPPVPDAALSKVGRGNPPKHSQFRKGVSGNKKGRPKGSKNLSTLIMEAARDQVVAIVDGKPRRITKLQATTVQLATQAAKGDQRAMAKLCDWVDEIERRAAAAKPTEFPFSGKDLDVLHTIMKRMIQCAPPNPGGRRSARAAKR
jgi:hypothetical protein